MKARYLLPLVFGTAVIGSLLAPNWPRPALAVRHFNRTIAPHRIAEKERFKVYTPPPPKPRQLGCCEYDRPPCWCVENNVGYSGGCSSAEEYVQDVAIYGQPRCGMTPFYF